MVRPVPVRGDSRGVGGLAGPGAAVKGAALRRTSVNPLARVFRTRTVESAFRDQTGLLCV